jgi:threonine dehydrogenase-like Zn-dependent dehydrogenase
MAVRWANALGTESILINDLSSFRLEHAVRGGATSTVSGAIKSQVERLAKINRINEIPTIVDTTGNPEVLQHALAAAPMFGKIVMLGDTGYPNRQCLNSNFMSKGLILQAVHDSHDLGGWTQQSIDRKFFSHLIEGDFNVSGLITHDFSPADCTKAYQLAKNSKENVLGILYDWSTTK